MSDGQGHGFGEPAVFAQPWWLRAMNVVAASAIAVFVLGSALDRSSPTPLLAALAWAVAAACLCVGIRAMLSQVSVTSDSVRYRGIIRNQTIPLAQVIGFERDASWLAVLMGDVPSILSKAEDGTVRATRLWCFVISRQAAVGRGPTRESRDALGLTLVPYIRKNLGPTTHRRAVSDR